MTALHVAAGLYALFMLVRHVPPARRGRLDSILVCAIAVAVLAMSARGLLAAVRP